MKLTFDTVRVMIFINSVSSVYSIYVAYKGNPRLVELPLNNNGLRGLEKYKYQGPTNIHQSIQGYKVYRTLNPGSSKTADILKQMAQEVLKSRIMQRNSLNKENIMKSQTEKGPQTIKEKQSPPSNNGHVATQLANYAQLRNIRGFIPKINTPDLEEQIRLEKFDKFENKYSRLGLQNEFNIISNQDQEIRPVLRKYPHYKKSTRSTARPIPVNAQNQASDLNKNVVIDTHLNDVNGFSKSLDKRRNWGYYKKWQHEAGTGTSESPVTKRQEHETFVNMKEYGSPLIQQDINEAKALSEDDLLGQPFALYYKMLPHSFGVTHDALVNLVQQYPDVKKMVYEDENKRAVKNVNARSHKLRYFRLVPTKHH